MCKSCNNYNNIKLLAIKLSKLEQTDVQIYKNINGYNFEPINSNRGNIIEIIKWVKE